MCREEFKANVRHLGPKERAYACLRRTGVCRAKYSQSTNLRAHARRILTWYQAFERFDRDKNGCLSKSEFAEALRASGLSITGAEISKFFKKLDKDCNEMIDFKVCLSALSVPLASSSQGN